MLEKCVVWYHAPGVIGENNDGELNELMERGWKVFGFSDPVVVDGKALVFVNLGKKEKEDDEDEDDDSELEE